MIDVIRTLDKEIVRPKLYNGIEFYLSSDRNMAGVSQAGLARLCGVTEQTIRTLISDLKRGDSMVPIDLLDLRSIDLYVPMRADKNAKVIDAKYAATIVNYYAYLSPRSTETARQSAEAFGQMGMLRWIESVVVGEAPITVSKSAFDRLLEDVENLKNKISQTTGYQIAAPDNPGLVKWMAELASHKYDRASHSQLDIPLTSETPDKFTINDWLGLKLGDRQVGRVALGFKLELARSVAHVYAAMTGEAPEKVHQLNSLGKKVNKAYGYDRQYLSMIELCYDALIDSDSQRQLPPAATPLEHSAN